MELQSAVVECDHGNPQRMMSHQMGAHLFASGIPYQTAYTLQNHNKNMLAVCRAIEIINSFIKFTMKLNHKMTNYENEMAFAPLHTMQLNCVRSANEPRLDVIACIRNERIAWNEDMLSGSVVCTRS